MVKQADLFKMAFEIIQITTGEESEKLMLLEEAAADPPNATSTKPLIQKVAYRLRARYNDEERKRYFEPISVTIGPLHHERDPKPDSPFERGEKFKLQLAGTFIKKSGRTKEDFYSNVKKEINSLKKCYDPNEVEKWNDEELAWMFLVDGCALLHFILLDVMDKWKQVGGKNDLVAFAKLDLFLLENQLPYKLLEILIGMFPEVPSEEGGENCQKELKDSVTKFIDKSFLSPVEQQLQHPIQVDSHHQIHPPHLEQQKQEEEKEPAHLLALLRKRLIGTKAKEKGKDKKMDILWEKLRNSKLCSYGAKSRHWHTFRNVKELKEKGIRFKASKERGAITDIDFDDRFCMPTLTLSPILVDVATMPKLLNLIAYEMCPDFKNEFEITSYVSFLDSLIDSREDVKELRDAGVLRNELGSDKDVAVLFNKISDKLVPNLEIHFELKRRIQEHCNIIWARDVAKICHTYFRSPWSFIVFLGVITGLVMAALQTYNSFKETYYLED
ncbi:hypothetical protein SLE2022_135140 [Rubroshorea leprosula]